MLESERQAGGAIAVLGLGRPLGVGSQKLKLSDIGLKAGALIPTHGGIQNHNREKLTLIAVAQMPQAKA